MRGGFFTKFAALAHGVAAAAGGVGRVLKHQRLRALIPWYCTYSLG